MLDSSVRVEFLGIAMTASKQAPRGGRGWGPLLKAQRRPSVSAGMAERVGLGFQLVHIGPQKEAKIETKKVAYKVVGRKDLNLRPPSPEPGTKISRCPGVSYGFSDRSLLDKALSSLPRAHRAQLRAFPTLLKVSCLSAFAFTLPRKHEADAVPFSRDTHRL